MPDSIIDSLVND